MTRCVLPIRLFTACRTHLHKPAGGFYYPQVLIGLLAALLFGSVWAQSFVSYTVRSGDTLYALASQFETNIETLKRANGLTGSHLSVGQVLQIPVATPVIKPIVEFQATGRETLEAIAQERGITLETLLAANPLLATVLTDAPLFAGTSVIIPPDDGLVITLRPGETILEVALSHGISPAELLQLNGLSRPNEVSSGQRLFIPAAKLATPPPPSPVAATQVQVVPPTPSPEPSLATVALVSSARSQHLDLQLTALQQAVLLLADYQPVSQSFHWPLSGRLTSRFGRRNISVGGNTFHGGIDIAAPTGTPIAAARSGFVSRASWMGAYGYVVFIDHNDGSQTRYAHLSRFAIQAGAYVVQGQVIGYVGSTGASTGPHLHFEIRFAGRTVDPLGYLE